MGYHYSHNFDPFKPMCVLPGLLDVGHLFNIGTIILKYYNFPGLSQWEVYRLESRLSLVSQVVVMAVVVMTQQYWMHATLSHCYGVTDGKSACISNNAVWMYLSSCCSCVDLKQLLTVNNLGQFTEPLDGSCRGHHGHVFNWHSFILTGVWQLSSIVLWEINWL